MFKYICAVVTTCGSMSSKPRPLSINLVEFPAGAPPFADNNGKTMSPAANVPCKERLVKTSELCKSSTASGVLGILYKVFWDTHQGSHALIPPAGKFVGGM